MDPLVSQNCLKIENTLVINWLQFYLFLDWKY